MKRKRSRVSMPASGAGLVRYMDEEGKGFKLKPEHVLFASAGVIIFETLLSMGFL
ncbi:MAG: preprotein translocase subunit Sec61beta [Candidatus Hydrothermarchaeota archaeon]|nr:preprotein translocase subunit Sec61beta [Candidatus Hydrothermarchaeota archaeon]